MTELILLLRILPRSSSAKDAEKFENNKGMSVIDVSQLIMYIAVMGGTWMGKTGRRHIVLTP